MSYFRRTMKNSIRGIENISENAMGFIEKYNNNWKLKHQYTSHMSDLPLDYKREIEDYWKKYCSRFNTDWHRFYFSQFALSDVRFIPDDVYYAIIDKHFNNRKMNIGVDEKNYYNLWFPDTNRAKVVVRKINGIYYNANYKIIEKNEVIRLCMEQARVIIKPSVGIGRSTGISFLDREQGVEGITKLLFDGNHNLVVQEIIQQHKDLSKIHPPSVNTIRSISLLFNGKVHILSSILRMGINGNQVDNICAGGIMCGIKDNGQLKDIGYSLMGDLYDKHPQGTEFKSVTVPSYDKVKQLIIREQEKFAHFRLISWDIAVEEDGEPVLIEVNLCNGGMRFHQFCNGPLFGELTDEVLEEVFVTDEFVNRRRGYNNG